MLETDANSIQADQLSLLKAFEAHPDVLSLEDSYTKHASRTLNELEYALVVQFVEKYCTLLKELNEALEAKNTTISGQR